MTALKILSRRSSFVNSNCLKSSLRSSNVIETALHIAGNDLSAIQLKELLAHSKSLLHLPATPLPEVEETLKTLRNRLEGERKMVVFTKGELQDQENKLKRSGLLDYFDDVEITSDKSQREFLDLCEHQQIHPSELLMIGNSLKSDIAPALAIGAWAIHIPFHVTWQLEHSDDIDHERLIKISRFSEILNYI